MFHAGADALLTDSSIDGELKAADVGDPVRDWRRRKAPLFRQFVDCQTGELDTFAGLVKRRSLRA